MARLNLEKWRTDPFPSRSPKRWSVHRSRIVIKEKAKAADIVLMHLRVRTVFMMNTKFAATLAGVLLFGLHLSAAVVDFNFNNVAIGATSVAPSGIDPGLVVLAGFAGNTSVPPGQVAKVVAGQANGNAFGGEGWRNHGQYYSFEIQAAADHDLTLSRLTLDGILAPSGLNSWYAEVKIGNGVPIDVPLGGPYASSVGSGQFIDFSGSQFSHITEPVTIEIRNQVAAQDNGHRWTIDNVSLDGSVNSTLNAVPEPAAWGFVAVGALGLLAWRGRSRVR
jgi:hypothetical protein